jgi:hypothetical protein
MGSGIVATLTGASKHFHVQSLTGTSEQCPPYSSFPRKQRESRALAYTGLKRWIPACAGMTIITQNFLNVPPSCRHRISPFQRPENHSRTSNQDIGHGRRGMRRTRRKPRLQAPGRISANRLVIYPIKHREKFIQI